MYVYIYIYLASRLFVCLGSGLKVTLYNIYTYIYTGSLSLNGPWITLKKCHTGLHTTQTLWEEFANANGHIVKIPLNSYIAFVFRHLFCEYETESRRISQFHCSHVQGTLAFLQLLSL